MIKEVKSEDEMKAFGRLVGESLNGGEVIELIGDVGSGKTTFVKGVASGLAIKEYIQSPSFTINRVYKGRDNIKLSHYDFYRLDEAGIMADELSEVIQDKGVTVIIEWGSVVEGILPIDHMSITIDTVNEGSRKLTIRTAGSNSESLLRKIRS